jgi:hypothetical protein
LPLLCRIRRSFWAFTKIGNRQKMQSKFLGIA